MRVLIAEDDATSRLLLVEVLKKLDYDVTSVVDGEAAWAALERDDAPQLAVLDWMMPGLDGIEVCRRVRGRETDVPTYIVLLTALGSKEHIVEGLEAGADDYLTKPFDKDELRARLQVGQRVIELQGALARRITELQDALDHIKTLQGILPICMNCHKIRNDDESWERLDSYLRQHADVQFSHGVCPECMKKLYPEIAE